MVEIFVLATWVAIWLNPRWSILNKAGIVLLLIMVPSAMLIWLFAPDSLQVVMYWWTAYLALYLVVGSLIIAWRVRDDRRRTSDSKLPTRPWSPMIADALPKITKIIAPIALIFAVAVTLMLAVRGDERAIWTGLLFGAAGVFGPIVPFAYLWLAMKVADIVTASKPPA